MFTEMMTSLILGVPDDDGIHPGALTMINKMISKKFSLTKAEVSGLTNEHKSRLLESTFSKEELDRLIDEEVTHFFAPFESLLHLCFPALAEYKKKKEEEDSASFSLSLATIFDCFFFLIFLPGPCICAYIAFNALADKLFPSSQHGVARLTNDAAQVADDAAQGQLVVPSESSLGFSVFLEDINMQGLEGINEN